MTSLFTVIAKPNMSKHDDLSIPNTAEEFLRVLFNNIQGLNNRVVSMETKLDKFISRFDQADTISGHEDAVSMFGHLSNLAETVRSLSGDLKHPEKKKTKSGIIIPVGELYVDPTLISNTTGCQVTIQPPDYDPATTTYNPDFIVIQPSGDICNKLDPPDFREIRADVEQCLVTALTALSHHPDTQVFITSLPPRYDTEEASKSTDLWNNILVTETFVHDMIHVVHQTGLECKDGKKRYERFIGDGFLLTRYGTKLISKNIATSVIEVLSSKNTSEKIVENRGALRGPSRGGVYQPPLPSTHKHFVNKKQKFLVKKFVQAILA